ncbi:uncharacterized protein HMPREF1541_04288 [Cyphellophora europaea CBS 101466]|uniref:Uncharacterized protein n=1 Tax=Cyphellophora europaea (strain CBS 101466) TaxID=1220924 RepID=W2RW79_CYPE1|nr:uncharacterized protein HMPREF1541_04288 [Cyphellophora europaea CBS 101466]ETN40013.1 hypothetical protein HMPREF1541_04288 [Cyphellophora europaea CBS 101466]
MSEFKMNDDVDTDRFDHQHFRQHASAPSKPTSRETVYPEEDLFAGFGPDFNTPLESLENDIPMGDINALVEAASLSALVLEASVSSDGNPFARRTIPTKPATIMRPNWRTEAGQNIRPHYFHNAFLLNGVEAVGAPGPVGHPPDAGFSRSNHWTRYQPYSRASKPRISNGVNHQASNDVNIDTVSAYERQYAGLDVQTSNIGFDASDPVTGTKSINDATASLVANIERKYAKITPDVLAQEKLISGKVKETPKGSRERADMYER